MLGSFYFLHHIWLTLVVESSSYVQHVQRQHMPAVKLLDIKLEVFMYLYHQRFSPTYIYANVEIPCQLKSCWS